METLEPYLAEHPFFRGMAKRHIELIVGCASNVRFDAGQYLDKEGEEANRFWIIRHGRIAIEIFNPTTGPITIQTVGEGDVAGWSWLFPPYVHHFDTRALELTRAIALDGKCLRTKCENDHELGYELFKRFAQIMEQRIEATRMQLLDLYK
ncbi:MAG: cyclic nucleotide-binding domain-containing protein [Candidatus Zixiibacteriota bacterium]